MNKAFLSLLLLGSLAGARELVATSECEAYNNLKHTKNSGHALIHSGSEYQILREQKGNYFIKVNDAKPQMRWVDRGCFSKSTAKAIAKEPKVEATKNLEPKPKEVEKKSILSKIFSKKRKDSASNLDSALVLSWHNSFCESHSNKKECRRNGGDAKNHLVLHGLWPQPRGNSYCGVSKEIINLDKQKRWNALPKLNLTKEVKELMAIYMPGSQSNLQRHEYYKHGSCYSKDANSYYLDALTLTKKADETLGEYLRENLGKKVSSINIKKLANKVIVKGAESKVALKCKRRIIGEIWISINGKGRDFDKLLKNAKSIRSNCANAIVDKAGKFRR
jgi:ribonuclease T2